MSTKIEWTEITWNPVTGCSKISTGCRNCYAERMAKRLAGRYGYPEQPDHFKATPHRDKLELPYSWRKPRMIFVCSMGDLFHEDVPDDYIFEVLKVINWSGPAYLGQSEDDPEGTYWKGHTFQILTKRPERMAKIMGQWHSMIDDAGGEYGDMQIFYQDCFGHTLPHLWLGVTAENQEMADERIPVLLQIPAAVRFVSVEPMLGSVDISGYYRDCYGQGREEMLDWVICGGETGPGAREMEYEWARDLYRQCKDADVPFFFKKFGDAYTGDLPSRLSLVAATREYPKGVGNG